MDRDAVIRSIQGAKADEARRAARRARHDALGTAERARDALYPIVGEQLGSVTFVRDYVQLSFDGPTLTALTMPVVSVGGITYRSGEDGYRDALCDRIGIVANASIVSDDAIEVDFVDGALLTISLRSEDCVGPEAALFDPADPSYTALMVFQPRA